MLTRLRLVLSATALALVLASTSAHAIINQVDGTIVPVSERLQTCLNKSSVATGSNPAPGEGPGVIDSVTAASITPQTFLPAPRAGDGRRIVTFTMIGEGAGYQNRFGWYNVGDSPFAAATRREVYDCRGTAAACDCPCPAGPRPGLRPDGVCTHWLNPNIVEVDFDCLRGRGLWRGGPIAFYILTPEIIAGGTTPGSCPPIDSTTNRVYSTDNTVNDDGDYVHFLIYTSRTFANAFYFGWEDLFRGGDNDFEDVLTRAVGLVPTCNPTPEVCDGRDNNCNGMVDEGLGETSCGTGVCRRTAPNCLAGRANTCVPGAGSEELCDGLDNDCDGQVDEGVTRACATSCGAGTQYCTAGAWGDCVAPTPTPEVCDNRDNDCNMRVDDGLTRPCRTSCGSGLETCVRGAWMGCTAPTAGTEVCNGRDDDCNGLIDDRIAPRPCMSVCGPGTESCIGGTFVCNAPQPRPEICDGVDNDCNGRVDDSVPPGGTCGTAAGVCRAGMYVCTGGRYVCQGATTGTPETCDGIDNNCNGLVDEGNPGGGMACGMAPDGTRLCAEGRMVCREGRLRCEGGTPGRPEQCNCMDDNCDDRIDEDIPGLCPGQSRCIACECRTPCVSSELSPCSAGLECRDGFCVPPFCGPARMICRRGQVCRAVGGVERCVDPCEGVTCNAGERCRDGRCLEDNCYNFPCMGAEICLNSRCVANGCLARTCPADQFCRLDTTTGGGVCVQSCGDVRCPTGQSCREGRCVTDRCQGVTCVPGQVCRPQGSRGVCVADPCNNVGCGEGRVCREGRCVDDPCVSVTCPGAPRVVCVAGQCVDPNARPLNPDRVVGAGGGGCSVGAAPASRGSSALWLAVAGVAVALVARRRGRGRVVPSRTLTPALLALVVLALGVVAAGCESKPYCLNCQRQDAGNPDARDTGPVDVRPQDSCTPTNGGMEACDGLDNDCNGQVDEPFDVATDPRNCGMCGQACALMRARPGCMAGRCVIARCDDGWYDLNRNATDGCEYACTPTGDRERCDGLDNDCNGLRDEGFDLMTDGLNCGMCGTACAFEHASGTCAAGRCVMGACMAGYHDVDRDPATGCEYACTPSGPEVCDGRDNDCDRMVDEGFDTMTDFRNCGACGRSCVTPHADPACMAGRCAIARCQAGYADLNREPSDGCEWQCGAADGTRGPEVCDGRDNDCNGLVDDGTVMGVGAPCGPGADRGICRRGMNVCERGVLRCVGAIEAQTELCNGLDDDCDGMTDNPPAGGALPGTGAGTVCGTNVGACNYGRFECVMGAIQCRGETGAGAEVCDGVDNDCDGRIDEDVTPPPSLRCNRRGTSEIQGVCAGARRVCSGTMTWTCTYPETYRDLDNEALCDGLDNNCDGRVDEGCLTLVPAGTDVRLDRLTGNSIQPMMSGNGAGLLGVVYLDRRSGNSDIYFARSPSNGASWETDRRLDTDPAGAENSVQPWLAWTPGANDAFATWSDFRGTADEYRQVFANASATGGATWRGADVRVNAGSSLDSFNLRVVSTGGSVVAVWEGLSNNRSRHILYAVSRDRGATWPVQGQVDNAPPSAVASTPEVAVGAPGTVYVVWRDNRNGLTDIFFRASSDGAISWLGPDIRMDTDAPGTHASEEPSVAADAAGNVYVAWQDVRGGTAFDIYANRSIDGGRAFLSSDVRVDTDPFPHDSFTPTVMALPGGVAAVVWQDLRWGLPNVYASRSTDRGATWPRGDVPVEAGPPGRSRAIEVVAAATGSTVFAVWADDRTAGRLEVWGNYSLDGGATFQPADVRFNNVAAGRSDSETPFVYAEGGRGHVVWVDRRGDGVTGDVYYRALWPR